MDKHYDFRQVEPEILRLWEELQLYKFNAETDKPVFSVDFPPPYVSGDSLHAGHAANYTHLDILARFKRMQGYEVLVPLGLDDNGHPTEILAEKVYGISKKTTPREEFVKKCLELLEKLEPKYIEQFTKLGISYCRNVFYRTIGQEAQRVAQVSFLELYRQGRIYRAKDVVLWCPRCQTALAQADLEERQEETRLVYLKFRVKETGEELIIATTRPELLAACVAVMVHPNDSRYKHLHGMHAIVPLYNREVPIIPDEKVEPEFGTGAVMVCSFGDKTDVEWIKTHKLPIIEILDEEGKLKEVAGPVAGLPVKEAREKIIQLLKEQGLVVKEDKLLHTVFVCWRCKTPVEFLVKEQWFVKIIDCKEQLLELGRQIKWVPERFRKQYEQWVQNLRWDWVISRQRYFGVPIPVWYAKKADGTVEVVLPDESQLPVDPTRQEPPSLPPGTVEVWPETDVLDTWFISSLTPMIASGDWRKGEKVFRKIFPMDVRPQGYDIIRTWAFYTIVKAYFHERSIPWKEVQISGYVRAPDGRPMSKSLGNVITVDELLEKYGADGIRYWAVSTKLGEDSCVKPQELEKSLDVRRKLWNVARFLSMFLQQEKRPTTDQLSELDALFLEVLQDYAKKITEYYEQHEFMQVRRLLDQLLYDDISSCYIELAKPRLYSEDKSSALTVLYEAVKLLVKLYAPIMPFITEKIWQEIFRQREPEPSVHVSRWPEGKFSERIEEWRTLKTVLEKLRKKKTEQKISLAQPVKELTVEVTEKEKEVGEKYYTELCRALKAEKLTFIVKK
ncbi:MAG: valine--tRNA ligase [bacterium]|nr:valine--tRNA ligase [bacterium]